MQRDQKVGLALGVLLIGVVAAFFFRNEPDPVRGVPALENAADIDREISEKRLAPYATSKSPSGNETHVTTVSTESSSAQQELRNGERKLPRWEDTVKEADPDPFVSTLTGKQVPVPAPDPIQFESPTQSQTAGTESSATQKTPSTESVVDQSAETLTAAGITHEVQKGDTLSSIAGKYLGSQAKFQEIFAANRDQLADANDLQVGMKLRIPSGTAKVPTPIVEKTPKKKLEKVRAKESVEPLDSADSAQQIPVVPVRNTETKPATPAEEEPLPPTTKETNKPKFVPSKRRPQQSSTSNQTDPRK